MYINIKKQSKNDLCSNCKEQAEFVIIDNNTSICNNCGNTIETFNFTSSYRDTERAHISSKYTYDRKVHFRDCLNQFQGKQNSTIEKSVYKSLENIFDKHHLLVGKPNDSRELRFSKITKKHIYMFLKELGLSKHYENINLIHYNLTGIKPADI